MTDPYRAPRGAASPTVLLSAIRLAMLLGVLMFGAVAWWLRRDGAPDVEPAIGGNLRTFAMLWIGVSITGLVGLFAFGRRQVDDAKRRTLSIIAWALGEGAAIAGGVVYLLVGDARWYLGGLFVLLLSFILFQARRRD